MKPLIQITTNKVFLGLFILGIVLSFIPFSKECSRIQKNYEACIEIDSRSNIEG
jgi:hypothetical protein